MFGVSFAWYQYSNAESNVKGSTIKEKPTIIFSQTEYINSSINMPIEDMDRYRYANKNSFNIIYNEKLKKYEIAIDISLVDINMSEELKNSNYKYELVEDNKTIASGDFSSIGNSSALTLLPTTMVIPQNYPETHEYTLYIWLSDNKTNQNNLMNKKFSAKINVNSAIKR